MMRAACLTKSWCHRVPVRRATLLVAAALAACSDPTPVSPPSPSAQSKPTPGLPSFSLAWTGFVTFTGMGDLAEGAGMAFADLDADPRPDLILMAYDSPAWNPWPKADNFRYRVGYNVDALSGVPTSWLPSASSAYQVSGLTTRAWGSGIAVTNINANPRPDVIFMAYENLDGGDRFLYKIGYDMAPDGSVTTFSGTFTVGGLSAAANGAGVAVANLDGDARPEVIFMAYDDPPGANEFRYVVGFNMQSDGTLTGVSSPRFVPGAGDHGSSASVTVANLDADPRPEIIVMANDDPSGADTFRWRIGYNVDAVGSTADWRGLFIENGFGHESQGSGILIRDLDGNGLRELFLMSYDNPSGYNNFRYGVRNDRY